jgi:hypothetical protein
VLIEKPAVCKTWPQSAAYVCSGFSYVLCLAGSITVWHGSFTNRTQRRAADDLAATLGGRTGKAEEERASRTGLFWQVLGKEAPYAHSAVSSAMADLDTDERHTAVEASKTLEDCAARGRISIESVGASPLSRIGFAGCHRYRA